MSGHLIGINTAIYTRSGGWQGIGFAIPSNLVSVVAAAAKSGHTRVQRPWLGATLQVVTPALANSLGLKVPRGALVAGVFPNGPAARAGMQAGDVIVSVDGIAVEDPQDFDYRFDTKPLGGMAQIGLIRHGREMMATVALQPPPSTPRQEVELTGNSPLRGATVANLSPALAYELQLRPNSRGVVITSVVNGSTAQSFGFRRGDIVLLVNNQKIATTADLARITSAGASLWRITIRRGQEQLTVMFSG
jgi:S1-C subfamily serine protease